MFTAKVYRVMVGSLSGTMEEVFAAKETIRKWNLENAERTGKLYMITDWSANAEQIKDEDMVIGIVGNWIDNTDFIDGCIKDGKHVVLFFNAFQDPKNTIPSEQDCVRAFKIRIQKHCFCSEYSSRDELENSLIERLKVILL